MRQGHSEALALVNVYKTDPSILPQQNDMISSNTNKDANAIGDTKDLDSDPDIKRANLLVELHHRVKVAYLETGLDRELQQARRDVDAVLRTLETGH